MVQPVMLPLLLQDTVRVKVMLPLQALPQLCDAVPGHWN